MTTKQEIVLVGNVHVKCQWCENTNMFRNVTEDMISFEEGNKFFQFLSVPCVCGESMYKVTHQN